MKAFVDTWHLIDVRFFKPDGTVVRIYGEQPRGMLVYDARGNMTVQIMRRGRPPLPKSRRSENALDEYNAILRGYIAYFGKFSVDETARTMTHHIEGSLIPNWVDTPLVRTYEFSPDGKRLYLRTAPAPIGGDTLSGELIWERAS